MSFHFGPKSRSSPVFDLNLSPRFMSERSPGDRSRNFMESGLVSPVSPRTMKRKFKITNQLVGKGVHGNVFLAYDVVNNMEVIAKKISVKKYLHIYKLEVKILKQLEGHPNIVKILGHKVTGSSGLIFLEKINGRNLSDYVLKKGGICEKLALNIFSDIVNAVSFMHSHRISHHDLKTENIVFDEVDEIAKVVDYGLSVSYSEENPFITSNAGSPLFAAPEVLQCLPHDPRLSDIWSLGVILYFLLTMTLPWGNVVSFEELVDKVTDKNLEISYPEDKIDEDCSEILRKIFVLDPQSRINLSDLKDMIKRRKQSLDELFSLSPSKSKTINEN